MPRQKGTVPPAVRIRDNQRRSRQRRKELIEDLKTKLSEYEKSGIHATTQVQLAARRVTWENAQLRNLLASKGVSKQEVDYWLQRSQLDCDPPSGHTNPTCKDSTSATQCDPHVQTPIGYVPIAPITIQPNIHPNTAWTQLQSSSSPLTRSSASLLGANLNTDSELNHATSQPSALPQAKDTLLDRPLTSDFMRPTFNPLSKTSMETCGFQSSGLAPNTGGFNQGLLAEVPDCYCPTEPSASLTQEPTDANVETPCELAANIIVGMRGYGDTEQIKEDLGCNGRSSCTVKNTTLLQVMMQ